MLKNLIIAINFKIMHNNHHRIIQLSKKYKELGKSFFLAGKNGDSKMLVHTRNILDDILNLEIEFWSQLKKFALLRAGYKDLLLR